ncbi:MAG: nucleoside triphosphate pyrophosphohydrolase [Caulobacteraceae bacterium]|nr:nucleoside triphosphate pyrophosphohydrolase [Caulobacteraceae bacterium]
MTRPPPTAADPMARLQAIMARLRDPEAGCPWDLEQTFASIAPYTVEEAYEVVDAIERGELGELKDELGDLLLQVVFHARIAEDQGAFDFPAVAEAICEKMIRRHPHVFGDAAQRDSVEQTRAWETIKAAERAGKNTEASVLDGVATGLPGLSRAVKLTARAGRVGFDWADPAQVLAKVHEELEELEAEVAAGDVERTAEELGDLLFVLANLARKLDIDPEASIRAANAKFTRRFHYIEAALAAAGRAPQDSNLAEMDVLWDEAKAAEKAKGAGPVRASRRG